MIWQLVLSNSEPHTGKRDLTASDKGSGCRYPESWRLQEEYLRRIVGPLPIHKELVLMLSFRQIQDGYEVILAAEREEAVFQLGGLPSGSRTN